MYLRLLVLAVIVFAVPAFLNAQLTGASATLDGSFQVKIFPNLGVGDSVINIGNTGGGGGGTILAPTGGSLCANIYVFSPDEQEVACCFCIVTPNGIVTTSARQLISKTLTPAVPTSITVKIVSSSGGAASCNPSTVGTGTDHLQVGLVAFGTNLHAAAPGGSVGPGTYAVTETPFIPATLSAAELARITTLCGFIMANGTGFGLCPGCSTGAAGAVKQ